MKSSADQSRPRLSSSTRRHVRLSPASNRPSAPSLTFTLPDSYEDDKTGIRDAG